MIVKQVSKRKPKNEYINNIALYNAIVDHYEDIEKALREGRDIPKLPNYIGECILLIAKNLLKSPNFYKYSWDEDMMGDSIENCIKSFYNFDPSKSTNPFSYFTQICYYASVRRVKMEKKQLTLKSDIIKNSGILESISYSYQDSDDSEHHSTYLDYLREHIDNNAKNSEDGYKPLKRLTKYHQNKLKEKEEIIKQYETLTIEEKDNIDNYYDHILDEVLAPNEDSSDN